MKVFILLIAMVAETLACKQKQTEPNAKSPSEKAALPFYNTADFTPIWIPAYSKMADTIHQIPAFSFIDQNGDSVTEKTVANKIYVADFFFTSCQGICPKLSNNLKLVQQAFKDDNQVLLLSHTVMPNVDNVEVLKRYAEINAINHKKWRLLTGDKDAIYTIARQSYFADEDMGLQRKTKDFLHTENMLLIDGKRRIRGIYKGTSPLEMQNIIADIKTLEKE